MVVIHRQRIAPGELIPQMSKFSVYREEELKLCPTLLTRSFFFLLHFLRACLIFLIVFPYNAVINLDICSMLRVLIFNIMQLDIIAIGYTMARILMSLNPVDCTQFPTEFWVPPILAKSYKYDIMRPLKIRHRQRI